MMGRNVKVPMNTYIAPHFQRRRLLSTGRHHHLVPLLLLLQSEESVSGTHLEPGCPGGSFWGDSALLCFLASVGSLHPREGHKSVLSFTFLDIRSSESPVSWHFRVDSLGPAGLSGQCWHTGRTPQPLVLSRDVNTDWGPTCTGSIDSLFRKSPKFKSTEATTTNITKYDSTEGPKSLFEILSREVGNTTRSRGFCSLQAQLPSCCV